MKLRTAQDLGKLLKARREALGISKPRALAAAELPRSFMSRTEKGNLETFEHLLEYIALLGGSLRITFIPIQEGADIGKYLRKSDAPDAKLVLPTEYGEVFRGNHPELV